MKKFIFIYIKKYKLPLILYFLITILPNFINLSSCYIFKIIIDNTTKLTFKEISLLIIIFSFISVPFGLFQSLTVKLEQKLRYKMKYDITLNLFNKVIQHNTNYFNNNLSGALTSKIKTVSENIVFLLTSMIGQFGTIFTMIISIYLIGTISIYLALFITICSILYFIYIYKKNANMSKIKQQVSEENAISNGIIVDCFSNINNIKSFSAEKKEFRTIKKQSNKILRNEFKFIRFVAKYMFTNYIIESIFLIICIYVMYFEYTKQNITLGTFIFFIRFTNNLRHDFKRLINIVRSKIINVAKINNGLKLLLQEPEIIDKKDAINLKIIDGKIVFKNINFTYK